MSRFYFDVETYKREGESLIPIRNCNLFSIGCVGRKGQYSFFLDKQAMKAYMVALAQKDKNCCFYAHKSQYDTYALFKNEMMDGRLKVIRDDPMIARHSSGFHILDTMALFPQMRLKDVGKLIGLDKLEMPANPKHELEIEPYVQRDVEITEKAVEYIDKTLKEIGFDVRTLWTTPQISMSAFIQFLTKDKSGYDIIKFKGKEGSEMIKPSDDNFIRKAYRLGRCEAFRPGIWQSATYIDQNRQFPYAASIMDVPNMRREFRMKNPLRFIKEQDLLSHYVGVARCTFDLADYEGIGLLPIRHQDYKMLHPKKGRIKGQWTFAEIRQAMENGYRLIDIEEAIFYPISRKNPFKKYFKMLYDIEKASPEKKIVTKLLMNGLIGKLGQRTEERDVRIVPREDFKQMQGTDYQIIGEIDHSFIYEARRQLALPSYANVMLATQIIATSRVLMNEQLMKLPREDLLYTDTDSIIFKGDHLSKFSIGNEMGQFKVMKHKEEQLLGVPCDIRKEKAYKIGGMLKLSGLGKDNIEKLGENPFEEIETGKIKNYKILSMLEAIKRGKIDEIGTFEEEPYRITGKKKCEIELDDEYDEEIVWKSG